MTVRRRRDRFPGSDGARLERYENGRLVVVPRLAAAFEHG